MALLSILKEKRWLTSTSVVVAPATDLIVKFRQRVFALSNEIQ